MKTIITVLLSILTVTSQSFAATNCSIVEYVDRSEVVCIGDETAKPEANAPVSLSRSTIADYIAQNQVQAPPQASPPGSSAVTTQPAAAATAVTSQPATAPSAKPGSAAENLAIRRELATRNTRALMNHSSATVTPGQ